MVSALNLGYTIWGRGLMKRVLIVMIFLIALLLAACAEPEPVPTDSEGRMAAEFVGMADSHTIEVMVNGEPVTLQLEGDARDQAPDFEEGDKVYIRYERREGVLYAQSIELAPPAQ